MPSGARLDGLRKQGASALLVLLLAACAGPRVVEPESRPDKPASPPAPASPSQSTATPRPPATRPAPTPMPSNGIKKGGGFYKDDGPGDNPPADIDSIPDAEPRSEPLHRFANRPYVALGQSYVPRVEIQPYKEVGIASWYGRRFHGARTSSGEPYDMYGMTAAHPTLPIPSYARVTNTRTGKSVVVRINDRGPFHSNRVIDLSYTAAHKLGYTAKGSTEVEVEAIVLEGVPLLGTSVPPLASASAKKAQAGAVQTPEAAQRDTTAPLDEIAVLSLAEPATKEPPAGFYLQLGAFSSDRNAEGFREYARQALRELKHDYFISAVRQGEREQFRLQLGPFSDASTARDTAERIAPKLGLKPFVVQR